MCSRAFNSQQCFISQSLIQRFVCPSAEISSRFCVGRLSACTKLHIHVGYIIDQPVANQFWWIFICLSFIPSLCLLFHSCSRSLYKGCACFLHKPFPEIWTFSRSPAHAGISSVVSSFSQFLSADLVMFQTAITCRGLRCWRANRFYRLMQESLLKFHNNPSQQVCVFIMKCK